VVQVAGRPGDMSSAKTLEQLFTTLTKEVPEKRRGDPDCVRACATVLMELTTSEDIEGVCIHEAGHFIYAEKLGVIVGFRPDDIKMHGPRIIFHPNPTVFQSEFEPSPGMIETPFRQMGIKLTLSILKMLANIAVAGGVFAGEFANQPTRGTVGDTEAFEDYYREALTTTIKNLKNIRECSDMLADARTIVSAEIDPEMESIAKKIAEDYKLLHFRPFLDYCDSNSDFAQVPPRTREV
jgi:hypothetical protein